MSLTGQDIEKAVGELQQGHLVAIPTETVYGLAARIADDQAVLNIFRAKNRPAFDPLIVHVAAVEQIYPLILDFPKEAKQLAEAFWPGPLTLLFRKSAKVSDLVTSGNDTVAIRIPAHSLTRKLLTLLGEPVAAPSANPFGYVSPTTAKHVEDQLKDQVAYILDGGPAQVGLESTIVSCLEERVTVLRLGGVTLENLEEVLGYKPALRISTHSNPQAPGQLDKHYATKTRLVLSQNIREDFERYSLEEKHIALLSFSESYSDLPFVSRQVLSVGGDDAEAARNLFAAMRNLDQISSGLILAETFPDKGFGPAINDRLRRAATKKII